MVSQASQIVWYVFVVQIIITEYKLLLNPEPGFLGFRVGLIFVFFVTMHQIQIKTVSCDAWIEPVRSSIGQSDGA